jgi:tetratricopeptide (TPR) repeat protein
MEPSRKPHVRLLAFYFRDHIFTNNSDFMEHDIKSDRSKQSGKSKLYLTMGVICLFLMALFWSLDTSFVYIFLGLATFFLFMGFYVRPKQNSSRSYQNYHASTFKDEKGSEKISDLLSTLFSKKSVTTSSPYSKSQSVAARRLPVIIIASAFIFFFIIFISLMFSADDDTSYGAIEYYRTAEQNYGRGNYDSAYLNYRKAWKLNPEYAEAILGYANVLAVREQYDSAVVMYDRVLEINPDYGEASYGKAWTYYTQQRYDESINTLIALLQKNADYYDAMLLLGDSYYEQKNFDLAIPWYENAYQNGGARSRILCHIMAYIYDTKNNYDKAIPLYKEALTYDSTVVDIYTRLSELVPGEEGNYYRTQAVKLKTQ